jgi:ABC-type histidine transport system ATPase subunit
MAQTQRIPHVPAYTQQDHVQRTEPAPLHVLNRDRATVRAEAVELLARVGLEDKHTSLHHAFLADGSNGAALPVH